MASIKKVSDGMVEYGFIFTEGKKEGAVDCALENPSVFTPTAVDEELTMFVSKIYEELTHRKELQTTLHALN